MRGLIQDRQLMISSLLVHAAEYHRESRIASVMADGTLCRHSYPELAERTAQLAHALTRLGVKPADRIATLAWNHHRHLELYYAIAGIGAVVHTINPRLFAEQIGYIVNHAKDRWLCVDPGLLPIVEGLIDEIADTVSGIVVLSDAVPETPLTARTSVLAYEELIAPEPRSFDWPEFDETTACGLCYTSGTTGRPKGSLYSHRSTLLHAWSIALPDLTSLRAVDVVLPIVPMFHVNAWGLPYAAPMVGASLAMPGPLLDGASLHRLIGEENVTFVAGVPTVWLGLLEHLRATGGTLPAGMRGLVGGSALPQMLVEAFEQEFGTTLQHGWGMTEMSPVGAYNAPKPETGDMSAEARYAHSRKQGRPPFGVKMKIVDSQGRELPRDGETFGELCVRGPWVTSRYFGDEDAQEAFAEDGWFRTGDVTTIDESGYMHIVDRSKDVIKSGGEWISSIELENIAVGHPAVREAAVIPASHPKWDERPLLIILPADPGAVSAQDLLDFFEGKVAKWMIPDDVVFVDDMPHTATGKIMKRALRERFGLHFADPG